VSCCRNGLICVWDTRCSASKSKPYDRIILGHIPELEGNSPPAKKKRRTSLVVSPNASVTDVLFHGENMIASAGSGDG
jgi:WD40 repeat protein